ncbi:lung seven transmembrane receptor-domain-containing protein [Gautieria morchelliformis]|nr:lung seven transmembrane receptor-domain-containing protein [Gautieria morchelliformis]
MLLSLLLLGLGALATAYDVPVSDADWQRQVCSGMWGGKNAHINVSFDNNSQGQVAMVIYEWKDVGYLGKPSSQIDDTLPRTYVCTTAALGDGFCNPSSLGRFIIDLPPDKSLNETTFWNARVGFHPENTTSSQDPARKIDIPGQGSSFWDNPDGNPTPPPSEYDTPARDIPLSYKSSSTLNSRLAVAQHDSSQNSTVPSASALSDTLWYKNPIKYEVHNTGYYCVAIVPLTVDALGKRQGSGSPHPGYHGTILFQNNFDGKLPATDYPKVNFYFIMFLAYSALGGAWAWLCYRHREDLLPIQYYISGLVGFLIVEMVASWAYYRYLNAHGSGTTTTTVFLFVVAILDAGRNALSFFLLLIVSMGLSVVRESLGRTMLRCRILTVAHFLFGVLYAVGIVELQLESTSALILLLFVIPLAFTLSGFMLWIMYALHGTINELRARKQHYKLTMFRRLYHTLIATTTCILVFFVVSTLQFSNRLAEDYAAKSWRTRWWLLDGFLVLLYLVVFWSIAYLWRPTEHNRR